MSKKTLIHIVSYKESTHLEHCLQTLEKIKTANETIILSDNASNPAWLRKIEQQFPWLTIKKNKENIGFCGAHNYAAKICLDGAYDGLLILNPDVELLPNTLYEMWLAIKETSSDAATPLLLRTRDSTIIDAAGMYFTPAIRHFDRFSGEEYKNNLSREYVIAGTGACLLLTREYIQKVILPNTEYEADLYKVYPQLEAEKEQRISLFDEAFFAYREDAELGLRAKLLGLKTIFSPKAVAYHVRGLKPNSRQDSFINSLGVKNRFLLQLNIFPLSWFFYPQGLIRNIVVVFGVCIKERSSLKGLKSILILRSRARSRYHYLNIKIGKSRFTQLLSMFCEYGSY